MYELCIPCCVADLHAREYVFLINFFGKHVKHEGGVVVADAGTSLTSEFWAAMAAHEAFSSTSKLERRSVAFQIFTYEQNSMCLIRFPDCSKSISHAIKAVEMSSWVCWDINSSCRKSIQHYYAVIWYSNPECILPQSTFSCRFLAGQSYVISAFNPGDTRTHKCVGVPSPVVADHHE